MHITSKDQVTIPQEIRERFGFMPYSEIKFKVEGEKVFLEKISNKLSRGELLIKKLSGKGDVTMSTDEIMALTRGA